MEGGGKCMVAIINGIHDAGISVTLVNDLSEQNTAKTHAKNSPQQAVERSSSVQTNTDFLKKNHTSSQICDGHFASSYQTAHCGVKPTSPPVQFSEFPPQRADPNTGQGNFEIGGTGDLWSPQTSYWSSREFASPDRGTLDNRSRENDAFVHSLRKYPNSPTRSLSAELVNRLLTYTQAKNLTKSSYHTKLMRTAIDRNAFADKETRTNSSKKIQTYARTKRSCKENGNTTDKDMKFDENSPKTKGLDDKNNFLRCLHFVVQYSVCSVPDDRLKDSNVNFMYDYLKSSNPLQSGSGRSTDVRYLTDVKKCIRDTVRQMYQERPVVCPRIRSRYSNHRREHHRLSVERELNSDSNICNTEDRASSPLTTEVSVMSQCEAPTNNQSCSAAVNLGCVIKKPLPCSCKPGPSKDISTKVLIKCACVGNSSDLKGKIMKEIISWIKSIPVHANESKRDKEKRDQMVKELAELLEKAIAKEDFKIMKQEVDFCLDNLPMWCPEGDSEQKTFKNQIAEKLIEQLRCLAEKDIFIDEIVNWVKNINFKDDKTGVLNKADVVQELQKRIKSLKRSLNDGDYKDTLISVITDVLEELPIETDGNRDNTLYHLASNLANRLIKVDSSKINSGLLKNVDKVVGEDLEQSIIDEICNIFDNTDINLTKTKKTTLHNKIAKILSNNIKNLKNDITDKTKKEIIDLLENETDIRDLEVDNLANTFINRVKVMRLPNRRKTSGLVSQSTQLKDNFKESVKEEVTDIFNRFKIKVKDRETLEETISNLLEDEIVRGVDINKVRHDIQSLLYNANISEEQAENISVKLSSRAREMSLCYKTKDSTLNLNTKKQQHEDSFKKNATEVVLDFVQHLDKNDSPKFKAKVKEVSENFIDNVAEIMLNSNYDKNTLFKEVSIYLENLPIKYKTPKEELARQLIKSLQNINIHISTPRKEKKSFRPRRESTGSTISSIYIEDIPHTTSPTISNEEEMYNNELIRIFQDWVNGLPIDFNVTDVKGFREMMINDLVADLIDRQKYLQLNPVAKVSGKDELEHLKYQVFRWLNKIPNIDDLTDIMLRTDALMDDINNIQVPMLVTPISHRKEIKLREGKIPTYMDALQDEISIWLNETPKDLGLLVDKSQLDTVIAELAEIIQELNNTEADIEDGIMNWLKKITKNTSHSKLNKVTQNLINMLKTKGFTDHSNWITVQNTSQFIDENLNGALIDWLKDLPLYQTRNSQERFVQEKIVTDLTKDMRRVFDNLQSTSSHIDSDKLLLDEIEKHLKRFPMEIENKTDENYIKSIAQQLLNFLKGLQIFQDISFRQLTSSDENLETKIEDWVQSLFLTPRSNSTENGKFEELTKQFKATVKQLKQNHANNQTILKEILKYLTEIPIEVSKKNNETYLNDKAQQLLNSLQTVTLKQDEPSHISEYEVLMSNIESSLDPKDGYKKAADILYENIQSWCDKLPIYGSDLPEEKDRVKAIKQNISSKLIKKIGELNIDPEIFYDDFIYDDLLKDEIENLLSVLPINREIEKDYENLKLDLFNKVLEVKEKTKNELAGHLYKQRLRDAISKSLPLNDNLTNDDDEAFFQNLRENVADAFINLCYFGAKQELRNKFRTKINEEITEFCSNYLKRFPATPIDTSKLNRELYIALRNVPVPTEESIRSEVEETRIKDEIQDWMKELPLRLQTVLEKQYTNKITSILSKRLHDIEKNKKLISNYTERMKTEIIKWIKKFPLKPEGEREIDHFAKKLIEKLEITEESRRFSVSLIQPLDKDLTDCSKKSNSCQPCHQSRPPSSLNIEDRALLQRIRERTTSTKMMPNHCKDASVSPPPIDAESQTELRHCDSFTTEFGVQQTPSMQAATQVDKAPQISSTRRPVEKEQSECGPCFSYKQDKNKSRLGFSTGPRNHLDISPRIIVKEYRWDSTLESSLPCQSQPCVDSPGLGQPLFKQQPESCDIPSAPCAEPFISSQTSRYLPAQQNHVGGLRSTKRPDQGFIQPSLEQESSIPQNTIRCPRDPTFGSLDAVEDSGSQRLYSGWSPVHLPENNNFWSTTCNRRRVVTSQEDIGQPYTIERERSDEKVRCTCRDHILTKCSGRYRGPACQSHDSLKQCPRCCGTHCPYPSYLYFRQ